MSTCDGVAGSKNCNFTCPKGGTFFVCPDEPHFVGCCSSDPCKNKVAPYCSDLSPASYNTEIHNDTRPNQCLGESSSKWYTCAFNNPPFMGCCKSNPCESGSCPTDDLIPSAWSQSIPGQLQFFLDGATLPSSSNNTSSSDDSGLSTGAIAGIAGGGGAALLILLVLGICFYRRRRRRSEATTAMPIHADQATGYATPSTHQYAKYQVPPEQGSPMYDSFRESYAGTLPAYPSPTPNDKRYTTDTFTTDSYRYSHQSQPSLSPQPPHSPFNQGLGITDEIQELEGSTSHSQHHHHISELDGSTPQTK